MGQNESKNNSKIKKNEIFNELELDYLRSTFESLTEKFLKLKIKNFEWKFLEPVIIY